MLTGTTPFGKQTGPEVVIKVVRGVRPSKPANARDIGLSDQVWELLEGCWEEERSLRPPVRDVLARLNLAASARRILPRVGAVVQGYVDVHSGFNKFGMSLFWSSGYVGLMLCRSTVPRHGRW